MGLAGRASSVRHGVEARPEGCRLRIELRAVAAVELAVRASYGPLIGPLVRNLARTAAGPA